MKSFFVCREAYVRDLAQAMLESGEFQDKATAYEFAEVAYGVEVLKQPQTFEFVKKTTGELRKMCISEFSFKTTNASAYSLATVREIREGEKDQIRAFYPKNFVQRISPILEDAHTETETPTDAENLSGIDWAENLEHTAAFVAAGALSPENWDLLKAIFQHSQTDFSDATVQKVVSTATQIALTIIEKAKPYETVARGDYENAYTTFLDLAKYYSWADADKRKRRVIFAVIDLFFYGTQTNGGEPQTCLGDPKSALYYFNRERFRVYVQRVRF